VWPDGSVRWVLVRGQTNLGEDSQPGRLTAVSLDITARKEAEREQVRLREEAVRASRAKDDFLAALSHELRTPLNPVLLVASDAVQDPELSPDVRESFEMIRRNIELEARLIDDLLDLTSIVRGKLAVRKEVCDLHALLSDALAAVRQDFTEKDITLAVSLGARRPEVYADELRIVQVFINVLKNAAKFTPTGGRVTVETVVEDGGMFSIRVTDTGIGMTPEEIARAFDAFEQGDHASPQGSHRFGGLGLGLAISLRLVELHDGTLAATSQGRDRGTTFTVRLPVHREEGADKSGSGASAQPSSGRTDGPGRRLLLVEDHESTRQALGKLLQKRGYEVVTAGSVAQALACAEAGRFDLVISDLGLPDGDGAMLMIALRDRFGLGGIALTGFGMDEDIERCRAAGFTAHLTKPVTVNALDAALRSFPPKDA
jgi:signal transduction histidine kinase